MSPKGSRCSNVVTIRFGELILNQILQPSKVEWNAEFSSKGGSR